MLAEVAPGVAVGQKNAGQRPAVQKSGGTKSGLAPGEWCGGDDARTFFDRDDLIGWDIGCVIGLTAWPADFDGVGFSTIAPKQQEISLTPRRDQNPTTLAAAARHGAAKVVVTSLVIH